MSDWTAERLDALPDNTLIEYGGEILHSTNGRWRDPAGIEWTSGELIDLSGSTNVRVVSVPVEALLIPDAVLDAAGRDYWINGRPYSVSAPLVASVIRAAIAYATGDTPG